MAVNPLTCGRSPAHRAPLGRAPAKLPAPGHYNSVRHELLLICTRGSSQPDQRQLFDSVQSIERGRHSAKPVKFYDIIETLYTHGRKLEMYGRARREGWDVYGHMAELQAAE
jgi:N6-adenosine-specific RNA methylase IME4